LLWDEVKQYSASVGSRQAALLHEIWASPISEGEDPIAHLARIRSAHAQINAGGENLSDRMLGYAMTMALPESFAIIKQNLWLRELLRSDVAGAVQAGARRKTNDTTIALFVQRNNNKNDNKTSNRILGPNPSAYCDQNKAHGHSTMSLAQTAGE